MRKYSKEIQDFIKLHVVGTTTKELVELVNSKFNAGFTESKMMAYKTNHKLKSGMPCGLPAGRATTKYPAEIKGFIADHYAGTGHKAMADLLNKTFGTNYTAVQIKAYYGRNNINSGLTGYFKHGHIPANKGKKGYHSPGCEKGWFKKGHSPVNHKPVGSERIDNKDGYTLVKTAEPNVWRLKHKLVWEAAHGKVPSGCVITFLDGNKKNFSLNNLALISKAENVMMDRFNLRSRNPEFTRTGILIAKIMIACSKRKKGVKMDINSKHEKM